MRYITSTINSLRLRLKITPARLPGAALVIATLLVGGTALAMHLGTRLVSSTPSEKAKAPVTIRAADRGKPIFNFADGRQVRATYRGNVTATQFLQSGQARPRAMATAVLANDAVPSLVSGYSGAGMGVVTVQHGNPEAFAPKDESVYPRIQQGYNPDALLPGTDTYLVPQSVDFLQAGDFNHDGRKDVLTAARGGDLFLLAGDGRGGLDAAAQIPLPGRVTAMAAGEFRVVDGWTDLAVSVDTPSGPMLLIFDGASALSGELASFSLQAPATAMEFADLDHDPFQDLALAAGDQVIVIHGWSRKGAHDPNSRVERTNVGYEVRDLAVGFFIWSRQANNQIAVLSADGDIRMLDRGSDTRPYTPEEAALFHRSKIHKTSESVDPELLPSWQRTQGGNWKSVRQVSAGVSLGADSRSQKVLSRAKISFQETDELLMVDKSNRKLDIVRQGGDKDIVRAGKDKSSAQSNVTSQTGDLTTTRLDTNAGAVAVQEFPQKINGERNLFVMQEGSVSQEIVPLVVSNPIVVDRIDDISPIPAGCDTAVLNDCSLRGAIQALNANPGRPITLPAGTYTLTINGTASTGCDGNSVGDLGINASTTITGAGSGTTTIRQNGLNAGNVGDRVICLNETLANSITYTISGVTIVGGRDSSTWTAGGIIGGAHLNSLTLNNVVLANNQASNSGTVNTGGGAIQIVGGHLTINNSTIGGSSAPTTFDPTNIANRNSTTAGNSCGVSGGGINHDPSSGTVVGTVGNLTVTSTTFNNNRSASTAGGGGGVDINNAGFGSGGGGSGTMTFDNCTFSNNQATGAGNTGNGGGLLLESLNATFNATSGATSFTSNSATNKGGAISNTGGTLALDGTSANGITFSSNSATNGGTSIFTNSTATVAGTNTTVGGSIVVATNGAWTNNAGSAISPTDFSILGGTATLNNSTMNVTGNFTIGPETTKGGILNANTGTINIQGNLSVNLNNGGSGAAGQFNAGTGTFNFNGTAVQTITNSGTGTPITFNNLTDSNVTQTLDVTNSINVNNTLNVNGPNAILNPAALAIIGGTGTLTGTGTARATRTAATADFLTQYTITNKTFTNLTIDYNGAGNQTVNNAPAYTQLRISGSGTKTLQGNTSITGSLNIAAATFASGNFNFNLDGNWTNSGTFTPGTGTVTFDGTGVVQALTGNTTFFNLTLNNNSSTTQFGTTTTTIQNNLVTSDGSMQGDSSTIIFTGAGGSISGATLKRFNNLQINAGANITNSTGGDMTIFNDYQNGGTFTQAAGLTTTFATGLVDGIHALSGAGTTTFGVVTINSSNTVNAGSHNFNVAGLNFTANGTFNGDTGTVTFNGGVAQAIAGTGTKNFTGLTINNGNGVSVTNVASAVDASVAGALTLTTDLTVASDAILQQSGTSAGTADVLGTVRRTDLGGTARAFGNLNNTIQINSGTAPTQMDFNLVKSTPGTFPVNVDVIPRTYTLTPTGGSGISATLNLRYLQTEVGSADEARFILWKNLAPWTPQGGTVDTANNFVSLSGVSSFSEWAIAEGSDLTVSKANNVANAAVTGQAWNWTLTATNAGAPATFTTGQTILTDNLPNSNLNYGAVTVQNVSNITGSANISCAIVSNDLTCTASVGSVTFDSNIGASSFEVVFSATPQAVGSYQNPRTGGGIAQIDPNGVIVESNETNNTAANNTVTVTAANTTTTISNAASLTTTPSVTGQPVTVQWNVTVNGPGSLGTALTGNVTVSDGTNNCVALVSDGQCDITFTSAGAKNITATYAGDSNYNGSASSPATPHTVNAANTTTTITSDNPDPSTPGQSVTVNYTVTANSPGSGTPAGNVQVSDGVDSNTCTVAAGTCALTLNTIGNRTITATYAGNADFNTSNDTESHDVCGSSIVTSTADSGAGSLRQIIADACDASTLTFNLAGPGPHTITLTTGELAVAKNLTINNNSGESVTVSGNNASRVFNINSGKTVGIVGLTLTGGSALDGGAITNDGTLTILNSTLSGNTVTADGGAISSIATATSLTLINTTISGNTAAGSGGGVIVLGGTMTSINSTITNNTADSDNNGAGTGGGIRAQAGTTTLKNTIVAGNFNEDGVSDAADDISGTVDASSSFNLIGTGAGGLTNGVNSNQVGVASAGLGPLAGNGGTTQTHALLQTSPAIEAGSNGNLPTDTFDLDGDANTGETLPVDQRGTTFPRVADSADADTTQTVDIGAFELHPSIEDIPDKNTPEDTLLSFPFNIGDGTGALITSVTATSSNTTLVPNLPANISVTGAGSTRTLNITPDTNRNSPADGTSTITVTVTATNGQTAQDTFVLTVDAVNDAPSFVKGADQTVDEDAGAQTVNAWATSISKGPADEAGQTLTFNISSTGTTGSLTFSSGPAIDPTTGNLTYTPTADTNGTADFSVTLSDNGSNTPPNSNTSGAQTFKITVNSINDPPSFTKGPDQNITDGAGAQTVNNWATNISQGPNETGQTLTFTVSPTGSTGTLTFSTAPAISATGTLTYTATSGTEGTATFDVTLSDNGSNVPPNSNTSAAQSFTITVNSVNDPPVNTVPGAQSIPRNTVFTFSGANQISVADADAAQPPSDGVITLTLTATNGTLTLGGTAGLAFSIGDGTADTTMTFDGTIPAINTALNGTTFTPTLNYTGAASVQIVSNDQGKTGPGGVMTDTDTVNFTITVPVDIYINEVLFNPPGTDAPNEYIELRGPASTVIPAGTYFVAIEGDAADNPGDVQTIINLSGLSFGSNGFLVIRQNGNTYTTDAGATVITSTTAGFGGLPGAIFQADAAATDIEDSSVSFMLIQTGAAPTLTDDIDANDDGLPDGTVFPGWSVRDSINAMNASALARAYGAFGYRNSAGSGTSQGDEVIVNFIPSYVGRVCDSTGSTAGDWVASGVLGGAAPNWTLGIAAETEPASFAGKLLNHIGASNFANLAPVNTVPGAQATNEDVALVFTGANQISIADSDAGGAVVKVTLTAVNGTFSLGGIAGLSFTTGDGTNDTQMVFTGTIANINTALNNLTFTPTSNFFSPPDATLTILTEDQGNTGCGGNQTDSDTINITVNAVNDPPSFNIAGNPAAVNEDAGAQTVNGFATSISQGPGESGQTLTFNITPTGTTGNLGFSSGPAIDTTTGNLTYTTSADTNGTATFSVTLSDNGSNVPPNSNTSGAQVFTITVNAVNDAPTFQILSNPPAVNEDAGAQAVNSFATSFQPGPVTATDEAGQTLVGYTVTANGTTGNLTFTSGPSINNAGQLTYTPTANTSGTATFNVVATDSGSGTAPNVNQSTAVSFTITVNGQNDAPVLDNTGNMSLTAIAEDVPAASNPGTLVSDIILSAGGDRITDVDAGALEGIAVIAVDNTNGTWQFSIDNGLNWTAFGSPNATTARLLAADALTRVRFLPNLNFNGTIDPGITFRAWDQTSGANGATADPSVNNGGTFAFSTATETASITVNAVNDNPTTIGIPPVAVNEDAADTVIDLRNFYNDVEDGPAGLVYTITGNTNPGLFTSASINNANDNLTLDYAPNASGAAQLTIRGTDTGGLFVETTLNVTVSAINDPPSFTKGADQTVNEDAGAQTVNGWATSISQGPGESGQTLTFNVGVNGTTGNLAFSSAPAIDPTTGALTYTTSANTNGTATIDVSLSDNGSNAPPNSNTSAVQQFTITVNAVNDAPTFQIVSNPAAVNEDAGAQTVNSFATNFQPGPATATDEAGQTLVGYTVTQTGTTGGLTFSSGPAINNAGQLTYTPSANTSGTATFDAVATDSGSGTAPNVNQSAPVSFTITVNAVNDAPVLDNTGNMSLNGIDEDVPAASNPGTLVSDIIASAGGDRITDVDSGAVEGIAVTAVDNTNGTWQFSIDNGTNWTAFGAPDALNARLLAADALTRVRFLPNLNFNGTVDPGISFRAWDQTSGVNGNTADVSANGGTTAFSTATETAAITVNPVNDNPTTTGIAAVGVNEDAADTVLDLRLSFGDVEDGAAGLVYTVQGNTNPGLFTSTSINNANDNLTLDYAPNANGTALITIRGTDTGGLFVESTFMVTVNTVNDVPSFTKGPDITVQDPNPQSFPNWATNILAGPPDESGQTLTFLVTNNANGLFATQPAISSNGTLTFTAAAGQDGVATVTVRLMDNGGTANGGVDTSAPQTFVLTVHALNNQPTLDAISDLTINEDAPLQTVNLTGITPGPSFESNQTLTITAVSSNTALIPNPTVSYTNPNTTGSLSFTPVANINGSATITVTVKDTGGTANGGVDTLVRTFLVTVNSVNDAPSFTKGPDQTVNEDAGAQTVNNWGTAISPGPANESGQTVAFEVTGNTNAGLFSAAPAISSTGTLTYTPAANANGTATITIVLKDDGGTANGGVDTSAPQTFTITVNAVNDAPVNNVPGAQNIPLNALFVFSAGTGNAISITDVDAGSDTLQVTIKATDGTITLNGTAGLSFTVGDGTDDPLMTFTGTLASINAALAGMKNLAFGSGVITITTNDLGHNGTGGPLSDTDTIAVTVADNLAPLILTIPGTDKAIAFDSTSFVVDPFNLVTNNNLLVDHRTHIMILALHAQLRPGETFTAITAEADVAGTIVPLIVESVNTVPNFDWLTQIVFKFPDGFSTGGGGPHDAKITIRLRGQSSNQAIVIVVPAPRP